MRGEGGVRDDERVNERGRKRRGRSLQRPLKGEKGGVGWEGEEDR